MQKKEIKYTDEPMQMGEEVPNFLPSPEELVFKQKPEMERLNMELDADVVNFFREKAQKLGAPYQRMIRNLLKKYVEQQRELEKNLGT